MEAVAFSGCRHTTVAVYKHAQWTANVLQGSIVHLQTALLLDIALVVGAATALPLQEMSNAKWSCNALSHAACLHPLIAGKEEAMAWTAAQLLAFHGVEPLL